MKEGKRLQTIYETFSREETAELGKRIGRAAQAGDVYTLTGELGVGKTVFTQGVAAGLSTLTSTALQMWRKWKK